MSGRGPAREGAGPEEDGERVAGEPKAKLATSFDEPGAEPKPLKAMKRTTYSMRSLRESWGPSDRGRASVEHAGLAHTLQGSDSIRSGLVPNVSNFKHLWHKQRRGSEIFMNTSQESFKHRRIVLLQSERDNASALSPERLEICERIRKECPKLTSEEITQLVSEFQYAVAELTEESKPDATLNGNTNKVSVLDATFKQPIVDLRLDAVQVEYVVRDVLRVAVSHDVLQELLHNQLVSDISLDVMRFAHLVHEIKLINSRTGLKGFPFDPNSSLRQSWDIFILLLLLYTCIEVPYSLAFNSDSLDALELVFDICFCLDIIINFCTAQHEDGKYVTDMRKIARIYCRGWFVIDLAGSFPFDRVVTSILGSGDQLQGMTFIRVIKMVRLLKLLRVVRMMAVLEKFEESSGAVAVKKAMRMMKSLWLLFFVSHMLGCLFFLFIPDDGSVDNWLYFYQPSLVLSDDFEKYTVGLYWAVITISTMGYGDVVPITHEERIFAVLCALLGACVFSYCMGNITSVITATTSVETMFEERIRLVSDYSEHKRLPDYLKRQIKLHSMYSYRNHKDLYHEDSILNTLPSNIRREVCLAMALRKVAYIPIFRGLDDDVISDVSRRLTQARFEPKELIYRACEVGDQMFMISVGEVTCTPYQGLEDEEEKVLSVGDVFGLVNLFPNMCKFRTDTVRARTHCEVYILSRSDYEEVAAEHPAMAAKMRKLASLTCMYRKVNNTVMLKGKLEMRPRRMTRLDVLIQELKGQIRDELEGKMVIREAMNKDSVVFHAWKLNKMQPPDYSPGWTLQEELQARHEFARSVNNWRRRLFVLRGDGRVLYASEKVPEDALEQGVPDVELHVSTLGYVMPFSDPVEFPEVPYTDFRFADYVFAFRFEGGKTKVGTGGGKEGSKKQVVILACEGMDDVQRFVSGHQRACEKSEDGNSVTTLVRYPSEEVSDTFHIGLSEIGHAAGGVMDQGAAQEGWDSGGFGDATAQQRRESAAKGHPIFNPRQAVSGLDKAPVANPKEKGGGWGGYSGVQQDSPNRGIGKGASGDATSVVESPPSACGAADAAAWGGIASPRAHLVGTPSSVQHPPGRDPSLSNIVRRLDVLENMPRSVAALGQRVEAVQGGVERMSMLLETLIAGQGGGGSVSVGGLESSFQSDAGQGGMPGGKRRGGIEPFRKLSQKFSRRNGEDAAQSSSGSTPAGVGASAGDGGDTGHSQRSTGQGEASKAQQGQAPSSAVSALMSRAGSGVKRGSNSTSTPLLDLP